jgi:hypothetical protein
LRAGAESRTMGRATEGGSVSGTYLHLVGPETIAETNEHIEKFRASRAAFDDYLKKEWGDVRYSHETFLKDCSAQKASGWEVYYLAHQLVNRRDSVSVFMDVEIHMLFLNGEWLPTSSDTSDTDLRAFFSIKAAGGLRITPGRSTQDELAVVDILFDAPPEVKERIKKEIASKVIIRTEEDLIDAVASRGLSPAFGHDAVLLNRLCGYRKPAVPRRPRGCIRSGSLQDGTTTEDT